MDHALQSGNEDVQEAEAQARHDKELRIAMSSAAGEMMYKRNTCCVRTSRLACSSDSAVLRHWTSLKAARIAVTSHSQVLRTCVGLCVYCI